MGFLDGLEKLINEHGSAVILRERIALLNDRHADLQRKYRDSEQALSEAKADNARLRAEVARLGKEVERLTPKAGAPGELDELREKILVALSQRGEIYVEHLATVVHSGVEATKFRLEELEEQGMVHASYSSVEPTLYSLAQEGRRYLVKKGLIR